MHHRNIQAISEQLKLNKITREKHWEMLVGEGRRAASQFDKIRTECITTTDELRERMAPDVKEKVVSSGPFLRSADFPDAVVNLAKITGPSWMGIEIELEFLLRELEELGRLLPNTLDVRRPDNT